MTHLHMDHTSAISEFPNSTFVVSEEEWNEATHGKSPTLNAYRRIHLDFAFDYRTVDFDRGGIGSYATFGRTSTSSATARSGSPTPPATRPATCPSSPASGTPTS